MQRGPLHRERHLAKRGCNMQYIEKRKNRMRLIAIWLVLGLSVLISLLAVRFGSVEVSLKDVIHTMIYRDDETLSCILLDMRLPRVLTALVGGACLAASGLILQAVMGNPLADPGLTGVTSGASLTVMVIMLIFPQYTSLIPITAFVGAVVTCLIVYSISWTGTLDPMRLVLSGVAVNTLAGGVMGLLQLAFSDRLQGVLLWSSGSLSGKTWATVETFAPFALIGLILALCCIRGANLLNLGDNMAKSLGVNTTLTRIALSCVACYLAAVAVSHVGTIGFVGLIVPHIARLLIGINHKYLVPFTIVLGAFVLAGADLLARVVFAPLEVPVGLIMSVLGVPFFLYLMRGGMHREQH